MINFFDKIFFRYKKYIFLMICFCKILLHVLIEENQLTRFQSGSSLKISVKVVGEVSTDFGGVTSKLMGWKPP